MYKITINNMKSNGELTVKFVMNIHAQRFLNQVKGNQPVRTLAPHGRSLERFAIHEGDRIREIVTLTKVDA